ncbi:MAG: DUF192 domain-containing protein [Parcubacteria group bacterium]|nr:DUF192 domain-containing protein [Parcubacteria group bacterium]
MKYAILAILVALLVALVWFWVSSRKTEAAQVTIGERATFRIEVASSVLAQAQGLSGRPELDQKAGMLFVFSSAAPRYFWMQGMQFPLDFVWIRQGKVVGINANIPHPAGNDGEVARINSPEPADMVLEINAGEAAKQGIQVGDAVDITPDFR